MLIKDVIKLKIKYTWVFIEYELFEVILFYKNKKIYLKCSYKILPFALEKFYPNLSSLIKLYFPYEILKNFNPFESCQNYHNILSEYKSLTLEEYYKVYALRDVTILKNGLQNFFKTLNELNISSPFNNYSCSGIAFQYYIQNWNKINLNLKKSHKRILKQAYFGGRCEIFGNPKKGEKILHFDFEGMYQKCMIESLPYGNLKLEIAYDSIIKEPGFYHIEINYTNEIPILPLKEDKLYFKNGDICGWYWYEEILITLKYNKINKFKINFKLISEDNGCILQDFINKLAEIRKQGGIKKDIGKLLINSFYGRLGVEDKINIIELKNELKNEKNYGSIENLFITKKEIIKNSKSNIAMAAAITSKARIKLYEAFLEILNNGGRLLYCDTDSIIAAFDEKKQIENRNLGSHIFFDTNRENTIIKDAVFINPKTYALLLENNKEIIKIKGMQSNDISFLELKNIFYSSINTIELPTTFFSKKNLDINILTFNKTLDLRSYNKRNWSQDYISTTPHTNKYLYSY